MQKILIANKDIKKLNFINYIEQHRHLEIIKTINGSSTLTKYFEIKPNVLILDSLFDDMNYLEIINRLSTIIFFVFA